MNGIQKQNTRQAMDILKSATDNKWDVRVSKNGNVRIASWVDRFKSEFTAFINPSRTRTNWVEKAELAIFEKLKGEISLLKGNAVKANNLQSLINNIKNENNQALKKNLDKLWDINDRNIYGLIYEELKNTDSGDLRQAENVANFSSHLISKFGLPREIALNTARKMCIAIEKKFAGNFNEAFELIRFNGELIRTNKLQNTQDSLELTCYIQHLMMNNKLNIDDALFCANSAKNIEKKENLTLTQSVQIAAERLNLMKKIQPISPRGLPLNIDGSTTELKLEFSQQGKETITEFLEKIPLESLDDGGVSSQFVKDTSRGHWKIKIGNTFTEYNDATSKKQNYETSHQLNSEKIKKANQRAVIDALATFANNDEDLLFGLSLFFNQTIGNSLNAALSTDFRPAGEPIHVFSETNDPTLSKNLNRGELNDQQTFSIEYKNDETILISYENKRKINLMMDASMNYITPLHHIDDQYELEFNCSIEVQVNKVKELASNARSLLEKIPYAEYGKQNLETGAKLLSSNVILRINPDWDQLKARYEN